MKVKLMKIYEMLFSHYGEQKWWPADTDFEVMVGAILTQNTNWGNVEKAIANLKRENALNLSSIQEMDIKRLEELIRPSGFYRQKALRLKEFCNFIAEEWKDIRRMKKERGSDLRKKLLSVKGIGPETADSILLYACEKPFFVIDAYTKRMMKRIGVDIGEKYEEVRLFFESNLPENVELYKEYHALIVKHSKEFCRKRPLCKECPLKKICKKGK